MVTQHEKILRGKQKGYKLYHSFSILPLMLNLTFTCDLCSVSGKRENRLLPAHRVMSVSQFLRICIIHYLFSSIYPVLPK